MNLLDSISQRPKYLTVILLGVFQKVMCTKVGRKLNMELNLASQDVAIYRVVGGLMVGSHTTNTYFFASRDRQKKDKKSMWNLICAILMLAFFYTTNILLNVERILECSIELIF